MIGFDDLIGKTIKVVDVDESERTNDPKEAASVTIEVDGVQYTLIGSAWNYTTVSEIRIVESATYLSATRYSRTLE